VRVLPVDLSGVTQRRSETWLRLAHRIGAFFGVDLGQAPAGQTWVMKYDALTVAEIARGGPLPPREWHAARHAGAKAPLGDSPLLPRGTWWIAEHGLVRGIGDGEPQVGGLLPVRGGVHEIAPATTGRFGPDRKAALVLSGANELFAGLLPVVREVMTAVIGNPPVLHPRLRLALWAILTEEAYRSQPALFAAAVQARTIQRVLTLPWGPVTGTDSPLARGEYGSPDLSTPEADPDLEPRRFNILDTTLHDYLDLRLGPDLSEVNEGYLRDDVITRWTRHLLESAGRGVVWVAESAPGARVAEVLISGPGPVISLVTEAFPQREPFPLEDPEEWPRFCPPAPSLSEASRLSERGRIALVWSLVQLYRVLRLDHLFMDAKPFRRHVTEQLRRVAELSAELLGPVHPMTYYARNRHGVANQGDQRWRDPEAALAAGAEAREAAARLGELRRAGLVSGGFYAEALVTSAVAIRLTMVDAAERGDEDLVREIDEDLRWQWDEVFATIGVDPAAELEGVDPEGLSPLLAALAPFFHDYAGYLAATAPDPAGKERALRLLQDVVVPARSALARDRHTDQPLRLSLQVLVDRIDSYLALEGVSPELREHWSRLACEHTDRITALPYVQQVLASRGELSETKLHTLTRVVTGWVIGLESGRAGPSVRLEEARAQLTRLAELREVDLGSRRRKGLSSEQRRVVRLHERLSAVEGERGTGTLIGVMTIATSAVPAEGGAGEASAWTVPLPDAELFAALRGAPRRRADPWPVLEVAWSEEAAGTLHLAVAQPILSPHVAAVSVRLTAGGAVHEAPLSWQVRPGHPVTMTGVVPRVPRPRLGDVEVQVVVRGGEVPASAADGRVHR
jgi:hypothetical protein